MGAGVSVVKEPPSDNFGVVMSCENCSVRFSVLKRKVCNFLDLSFDGSNLEFVKTKIKKSLNVKFSDVQMYANFDT